MQPELLAVKKTAICLFSWNKGKMLEQTLRALAHTDIGQCPIFVLLNGCTDDTLQRVGSVRDLFPNNPFTIIELPINIGAPAARNWLIHLPEVQACDHLAFMDDDVIMPKDWLIRFLTVMEKDSRVGVVGAKIVFPAQANESPTLQYIFRNVSIAQKAILKLTMAVPFNGCSDTGLYTFTRPCMNVMGCLHLLRLSALKEVGDFDIRYSPSQVDDLDHDLNTVVKGYKVMYCGEVTCEHHQGSGVGVNRTVSTPALGSILGNDIKMTYKQSANFEQLREIAGSF